MAYEPCFYTFIFTVCILLITWPLYVYFLSEWYSHRNHFVIRNRWPILSLIIITASIITQIFTIIEATFCFNALSNFSVGICNAIAGLVYYRSYLLYVQTIKTRQYLSEIGSSKRMIIKNEQNHNRHQLLGKLILSAIIIASIAVSICRFIDIPASSTITYTSFTITTLIGIICVINIFYQKVSDSIGITKECIVQISFTFFILIAQNLIGSVVPSVFSVKTWLGLLTASSYGLFSLFIAHNLIQKSKSTAIETRNKTTMTKLQSVTSSSEHHSTGLSIDVHVQNVSERPELTDEPSLLKWMKKPLLAFLGDNLERHTLFAGYLSECFALENILFLERAIILHHLIKKYKQIDSHNCDESNNTKQFNREFYGLKFNFLSQIYDDIEEMIENDIKTNTKNADDMMYKKGIIKVIKSIYNQFCCRDAVAEINVGYEIRYNLYRLCEMDNNEMLKQFESYDDLLMVFHYAIEECWRMCETIYGFQFKSYLRDKLTVFESFEEQEKPELSISLVAKDSAQN